jgi:hypothetical protein
MQIPLHVLAPEVLWSAVVDVGEDGGEGKKKKEKEKKDE